MVVKNKEYVVDIIDQGYEGEGIAKIDGFTIFVEGAIKGEKVRVLIVKVTFSHAFGKILEIIEESDKRTMADCNTYKRCGGCNLRHIDYKETLELKRNIVQNLVNKTLKNKLKVENTIGMENPFHYRNKAQYPVGVNKEGKPTLGVFAKRTHEVIPVDKCFIQNEQCEQVAKYIFEFIKENNISIYNEKEGKGLVRHIVVRIGVKTNEIIAAIVINGREIPKEQQLVGKVLQKFPQVKTVVKNVNTKNTNVILGKENIILYGNGYIEDRLGEYTFKISPLSFYQINPVQTEKLYNKAIKLADLQGDEIALDLYCGIGTIGIFASKYVKYVYGIEIVPEAIEDAKENCRINNIKNAEFFSGDVEQILEKLLQEKGIKPDVIFVDPPRKGLDNNTIENILKILPEKVIYISCNPATLVRDLNKLEDRYNIKKIQPVDMFPYTSHCEVVSVLNLK